MQNTRYPETIHVTADMVSKIDQALDPAIISSREAARNSSVSYVKGDIVADQLNKVFGPLGWGVSAKAGTPEDWQEKKNVRRDGKYVEVDMHMVMVVSDVTLTIKKMTPDGTDTVFAQPGIGYGEVEVGKSRKDAYGMAVKGAATDGLKRCASLLGKAFGMMMASNGSQEDVEYAHNGKAADVRRARDMRNRDAGNQRSDNRGGARQDNRGSQRNEGRADSGADRGRRDQAPAGAGEARGTARSDGPRHDQTPRDDASRNGEGGRSRQGERSGEAQQRQPQDDGPKERPAQDRPAGKQADQPKGAAGRRQAATDFNLDTLPVSQEEMTDFAATLVERVKELRQENDRRSLVKQHIHTIRNLDTRIRKRLVELLRESQVDVDQIPA